MDESNIRLSLQMPRELRDAARAKAEAEDVSMSQVIRWHLTAWVRGELPTRPPKPEQRVD